MQRIETISTNASSLRAEQPAASIPALRHEEAIALATKELEQFLNLLETLEGDDWTQPTACTLWNVQQMVAHQAGSQIGWSSYINVFKQLNKAPLKPYLDQGMTRLDAFNQSEVDHRAAYSPSELIEEIRQWGPKSIAFRKRIPAIFRAAPLPEPEINQRLTLGYLTNTILPRDMWMHRLDICNATGREFIQTPGHDDRIVALVVRELAPKLQPILGQASVVYTLTGESGGSWRFGKAPTPAATLTMDALDFNSLASERVRADEIVASGKVSMTGDQVLAKAVLDHTVVLY